MSHWKNSRSKIVSLDEAMVQVQSWKEDGDDIVFTNGCFDLLHYGHAKYLASAADFGHKLVVGLNSDESVESIKGDNRPINTFESRASLLASFSFVDLLIGFSENTPIQLIESLKPHYLIKGGDYAEETIVGAREVKSWNGQVKIIPFESGYSSSHIISKIREIKS